MLGTIVSVHWAPLCTRHPQGVLGTGLQTGEVRVPRGLAACSATRLRASALFPAPCTGSWAPTSLALGREHVTDAPASSAPPPPRHLMLENLAQTPVFPDPVATSWGLKPCSGSPVPAGLVLSPAFPSDPNHLGEFKRNA